MNNPDNTNLSYKITWTNENIVFSQENNILTLKDSLPEGRSELELTVCENDTSFSTTTTHSQSSYRP